MRASRTAFRYAKALFSLVQNDSQKSLHYYDILKAVNGLFAVELSAKVLNSPIMPQDLKQKLVDYALTPYKNEQQAGRFFAKVVEAGRVSLLPEILIAYKELMDEKVGRINAEISSAYPLSDTQVSEIQSTLKNLTKRDVEITQKIDSKLLGGFIVNIGNTVVDLSLKTKLEAITHTAVL